MEFTSPHIHAPQATHTHTAVLLHGRGSDGLEFAEELFSSKTSKNKNLPTCLPHWRWVFPTSKDRWTTLFEEVMCSWFDAYSLTDIHERQELQIEGLGESVAYVLDIIEDEIRLLNGSARHVYLGGISQGMATALWTVFCTTGRQQQQLGGILGFCGWLPFANQVEGLIQRSKGSDSCSSVPGSSQAQIQRSVSDFFVATIGNTQISPGKDDADSISPILATPVLLGHGTDDPWVSVELGRQACQILREVMPNVQWKEYSGAEGDGHWIKEPEGFDSILEFLEGGSIEA